MSYASIWPDPVFNERSNDQNSPISFSKRNSSSVSRSRRKNPARAPKIETKTSADWPIIVHSHLLWDWVWQRPQQFVSRLSANHKVLFVETAAPDPQLAAPLARFITPADFPNITVLRLQFPLWQWNDGARVDKERRRLVQDFVAGPAAGQFKDPIQWFYDPMAVRAFAGRMGEILTVYDCMDELSKFRGAPSEMLQREKELIRQADVMFTGGRKLFESKSRLHPNCHFYGCGVQWEHFGKAQDTDTEVPQKMAKIKKPVLGFFGVVDERMDYELIAALADADPDWSVVMLGPLIKVDAGSLPQRPNLHWMGQQAYADLPALCKAFDVCLMPFALNEATEFINPTKALEYMATGRPIVSTPVADVVRNFGEVVKIGKSPKEFISLCRQALEQRDDTAIERGLQMARDNSWESIVASLEKHVEDALAQKSAGK
jgi:glycosyltransferase involved in cell wall biosynthesis